MGGHRVGKADETVFGLAAGQAFLALVGHSVGEPQGRFQMAAHSAVT